MLPIDVVQWILIKLSEASTRRNHHRVNQRRVDRRLAATYSRSITLLTLCEQDSTERYDCRRRNSSRQAVWFLGETCTRDLVASRVGFNIKYVTAVIFFDMDKAYNKVWQGGFISKTDSFSNSPAITRLVNSNNEGSTDTLKLNDHISMRACLLQDPDQKKEGLPINQTYVIC